MARLSVIAKRNSSVKETHALNFKGLSIDLDGREVYVDGSPVEMTPKEFDLLVFIAENENIALSREKLLNKVWGYDFYGDDRTVDTHVKMLRNSIEPYRSYIVTVRGVGYKFVGEGSES